MKILSLFWFLNMSDHAQPDFSTTPIFTRMCRRKTIFNTPLSTAAPTSTPPNPSASPTASSPSSHTTGTPPSSDAEFKPKRPCVTPKPAGTPILLPKDILRRVGPTADRLGLSNNQLTTITAVIANHAGGELDDLSLSKSTARRHRASGRRDGAQEVRDNFSLTLGQVNFDGKLLDDLNGLQKVNRLAVLVVKETENQILGIAKTANATGEYFFYISFYISPISLRLNPDYSIINNLFINNLYITFNPPICRKGGSRHS